MSPSAIRATFYAAGLTNIVGILVFSKGFTSETFIAQDPMLFGPPGLAMICVWGLAYIALAPSYAASPQVSLVFGLEKAFYVAAWVQWLVRHGTELGQLWATDALSGLFYSGYGLIDGAFGAFFVWVWATHPKR